MNGNDVLVDFQVFEQKEDIQSLLGIAVTNNKDLTKVMSNEINYIYDEQTNLNVENLVVVQLLERKEYQDGTVVENYVVDDLHFYEVKESQIMAVNPPVDGNGSYVWSFDTRKGDIAITHRAYFTSKSVNGSPTIRIDSIGTKIIDAGVDSLTVTKIYQEMIHYSIEDVGTGKEYQTMTTNNPVSGTEYKLISNNSNFYDSSGIGSITTSAVIYFNDGTNTGTGICLVLIPYTDPKN